MGILLTAKRTVIDSPNPHWGKKILLCYNLNCLTKHHLDLPAHRYDACQSKSQGFQPSPPLCQRESNEFGANEPRGAASIS